MPWTVKKGTGSKPWKIVKKTTGKVVGSSASKAKAEASVRARYASESINPIQQKRY
jgi:hypothetical protein